MEKTIFTSPISNTSLIPQTKIKFSLVVLFFLTLASSFTVLNAQCSLACNGLTQVSLDQNCQARVTPAMILNDTLSSCPGGQFTVTIYNKHNQPLNPRDVVTLSLIHISEPTRPY